MYNENGEGLNDSVEELRLRLETMKRMMELSNEDEGGTSRKKKNKHSIIDASFLSFVFIVVLVLIIGVSFHAFLNLYHALVKKFHTREHTEL